MYEQLPKPPATNTENPFNKRKWQPSDSQIQIYKRKLNAATDPMSIIDRLQDGTLTKEEVDVVRDLYPKIYAEIQGRILQIAATDPRELDYQTRVKLSLLVGADTEQVFNKQRTDALQANFAQEQQQPTKHTIDIESIEDTQSAMERLSNK